MLGLTCEFGTIDSERNLTGQRKLWLKNFNGTLDVNSVNPKHYCFKLYNSVNKTWHDFTLENLDKYNSVATGFKAKFEHTKTKKCIEFNGTIMPNEDKNGI